MEVAKDASLKAEVAAAAAAAAAAATAAAVTRRVTDFRVAVAPGCYRVVSQV